MAAVTYMARSSRATVGLLFAARTGRGKLPHTLRRAHPTGLGRWATYRHRAVRRPASPAIVASRLWRVPRAAFSLSAGPSDL